MHVKGERWLTLAVKRKKVWLFEGGLILPLPASTDLLACEGNLSFVTFHLFSPRHPFSPSLSLSGIQLSPNLPLLLKTGEEESTRKEGKRNARKAARREPVSFCIWLRPC